MDIRIFLDFFRRYGLAILLISVCYPLLIGFEGGHDSHIGLMLAFLTLYVLEFYVGADIHRHEIFKVMQMLPTCRRRFARTLWAEGVLVPLVAGWSVLILGSSAQRFMAQEYILGWNHLPPFFFISLLICSGCWLIVMTFQPKSWLSYVSIILFAACALPFYAAYKWWETSIAIPCITIPISVLVIALTYYYAPKILDLATTQVLEITITTKAHSVRNQDTSISWFDRALSNPYLRTICGATSLIVLIITVFTVAKAFSPPEGSMLMELVLLLFFVPAIFFVLPWGAFLGSLRMFGSMPMPRSRLCVMCLLVPVLALSPVAATSLFFGKIAWMVYFVAVTAWLFTNAFYLRWNKIVAMVALNSILVILGFWPLVRTTMIATKDTEGVQWVDSMVLLNTACVLLFSIGWILHMLQNSNTPFQKKPGFKMGF